MFRPTHHLEDSRRRHSRPPPKLTEKDIIIDSHHDVGGFSDIWRGRWIDRGRTEELAIKVFRKSRNDHEPDRKKVLKRRLWAEVTTWSDVQHHPNVLPFIGIYTGKHTKFPALVSPLRQHGNIIDFLSKSNANRRLLCAGIANGLAHLHRHRIVHGDLKPNNVLIRIDDHGDPVPEISDFGRAKIVGVDGYAGSLHTTPRYTAPEILLNLPSSPENSMILPSREGDNRILTECSDVYGLGMVILHVISGIKPYCSLGESQICLVYSSTEPKEPKLSDHEKFCSMEWIWALLRRCWEHGNPPTKRCTASDCSQILRELPDPTDDTNYQPHDPEDISISSLFEPPALGVLRN